MGTPDEGESVNFIKLTSKACPACSYRVTHYHGATARGVERASARARARVVLTGA